MEGSDAIETLTGVGPKRGRLLRKIGISTVADAVKYYPRDYQDRSDVKQISNLAIGAVNTCICYVVQEGKNSFFGRMCITRYQIKDDTGQIDLVWYNQPYRKNQLKSGERYIFTGKVAEKRGKLVLESPDCEKYTPDWAEKSAVVPVYATTYKLSQAIIRSVIKSALAKTDSESRDVFPERIIQQYQLQDKSIALQQIHFPSNKESFLAARRRLVFEELFFLQLDLLSLKASFQHRNKGILFENLEESPLLKLLPYALTEDQVKAVLEIKADLRHQKPLNRLIQGDVGSGKTTIAMIAAFFAVQNGCQSAIMAPTEVLASQHYQSFDSLFQQMGYRVVLLTGSMKKKEKTRMLDLIATGVADVVIGTHAIIQSNVTFYNLGMVITDEQHRFGVRQRAVLAEKGTAPHVLVMTATPIPRTLGLILYGDLDISQIRTMPSGRLPIRTYGVSPNYRNRIYEFIYKEIQKGRQAYIICPAVEESEIEGIQSVNQYAEQLKKGLLSDCVIASLHGQMKPDAKQYIMEQFNCGAIQILVASTVIEVGVHSDNATVMVIENADRFGLSQLHQLRGRVGRGIHQSYCIFVTDTQSQTALERLDIMVKSTDGFEIAEKDLESRGPGDFFGTRQHGLPEMRIANLYKDMDILKEVQHLCHEILQEDPLLKKEEHANIALYLTKQREHYVNL